MKAIRPATPAKMPNALHGGVLLNVPALTTPSRAFNLPLFTNYCVALNNRTELPVQPLVKVGQSVQQGEQIAPPTRPNHTPIYAPTSGIITGFWQSTPQHPITHIELCSDGLDTVYPRAAEPNWQQLSAQQCQARLVQAGIAALEHTGLSLLTQPQHASGPIQTLIVNAAESDPWQTADASVLLHQAEAILKGIRVLCHCWPIQQIWLAIADQNSQSLTHLTSLLAQQPDPLRSKIQLRRVDARYPASGERQLVQQLMGQTLKPKQHSATLGILCLNVQTVLSAGAAVYFGEPVSSRVITLAGGQLQWQGQVQMRNGTRAQDLLAWAGYRPSPAPVLSNGYMMGKQLFDLTQPMGLTTTALLAPSPEQYPEPGPQEPCIRCGLCADVCPEQLQPQELWRTLLVQNLPAASHHHLEACILCAACNTVCPSQLPLAHTFAAGQQQWQSHSAQQQRAAHAQQRFEHRQERLAEAAAAQAQRRARRSALAAQRHPPSSTQRATAANIEPHQALTQRLASAEQKLAGALPGERKAMQMTVRKLKQQLARHPHETSPDA